MRETAVKRISFFLEILMLYEVYTIALAHCYLFSSSEKSADESYS